MKIYLLSLILFIFNIVNISKSQEIDEDEEEILNLRPVIGILMTHSSYDDYYPSDEYSAIPASYVKFLEQSGARVIPIQYEVASTEYLDFVFSQINGLLFTGGGQNFDAESMLGQSGYYLFQKAKEANDNGIYFPVWGTCLGFEMMATFALDFDFKVDDIKGEDDVTRNIQIIHMGKIFNNMPPLLLLNSQRYTLFYYHHSHCIFAKTYYENKKLNDFFYLTSTSQNDEGVVFISTFEAKNYPFYGSQFHPEKNSYEWKISANHTLEAVEVAQFFSNFFVEESRKNMQGTSSTEVQDYLQIFNYSPQDAYFSKAYEQIYFFKRQVPGNTGKSEELFELEDQVIPPNEIFLQQNQPKTLREKIAQLNLEYLE